MVFNVDTNDATSSAVSYFWALGSIVKTVFAVMLVVLVVVVLVGTGLSGLLVDCSWGLVGSAVVMIPIYWEDGIDIEVVCCSGMGNGELGSCVIFVSGWSNVFRSFLRNPIYPDLESLQ